MRILASSPSTPTPTPTPTPVPQPPWLAYLNQFRAQANLPFLAESADWSNGDWLHSRYMVKNGYVGHSEDPGNTWYTPAGLAAAQNGNVYVNSWVNSPDAVALDFWMSAPFHAISMIDPKLQTTGFGSYREVISQWDMGGTLDVLRGRGSLPPGTVYPLPYPRNGGEIWVLSFNGFEFPNPLTSCPGYVQPTGPAILLQLGSGNVTPNVTAHSLMAGSTPLDSCRFDETTYVNPTPFDQSTGRLILNMRDAIVILPRNPFVPGQNYTVSVTANGNTTTWSFTAVNPRIPYTLPPGMRFEIR
ncbi:MAG: CAP domain-containing protein [Chloroflexi bacterium]|nr:CAP domain-containing protein [Chloroflexota bacterium]